MKVGIVGCGAIGATMAGTLASETFHGLELVALFDVHQERAEDIACTLEGVQSMSFEALLEASDLVVQATTADTMPDIVRKAFAAGCNVLTLSAGGLAKAPDLPELAAESGQHLYVPSGAIAGIDAVLAAREAGLTTVSLATTKHPRSLIGAPYLLENAIDVEAITELTTIFDGTAREAIKGFPANSNVAITLSFAGIGMDETRVQIIVDPAITYTRHEVRAEGAAGKITAITECTVSPVNPKTSHLAIVSALALLRSLGTTLHIGT